MSYAPVVHLQSVYARGLDLTSQLPWLYIIALQRLSLLYVGETFDTSGLVGRMGAHFGPYTGSTLRKRVEQVSGIRRVTGPVLVAAARLPFGEDRARLDASSKQVRLALEAKLHERLATEFIQRYGRKWTVISTPQPSSVVHTAAVDEFANNILSCFVTIFEFTGEISAVTPFHLVLMERQLAEPLPDEATIGDQIEQIEVLLFNYVIAKLKDQFAERWWTDGVPSNVRRHCVERREEEGAFETVPPHAYVTLFNLKDIVQKNWPLYQEAFERIAPERGRDKATKWIDELNEVRKQWAHPVKKLFSPIEANALALVRDTHRKVSENFRL